MQIEYIDTNHIATAAVVNMGKGHYNVLATLNGRQASGTYVDNAGISSVSLRQSFGGALQDLAMDASRDHRLDPENRFPVDALLHAISAACRLDRIRRGRGAMTKHDIARIESREYQISQGWIPLLG